MKMMHTRKGGLGIGFAVALCSASMAASVDLPLDAADPAQPIEIIADATWSGTEAQATRQLDLPPFKFAANKGAVTLVLDYAAQRDTDAQGSALLEVSIECPEARQPCAVPIQDTVIGVRSEYMGQLPSATPDAPSSVWVGREARRYRFEDGTLVQMGLSFKQHEQLAPTALRARLVYGTYSSTPLPGQATRSGTVMKLAIGVLLVAAGFMWWLRR